MNEPPNNPLEFVPPSALESISRAEVDITIATARRFPRELSVVKHKMMSFATLDEATAESCFYSLPRGGKVIQGPSVRLAEIAVSCYGNLRAGSRIISIVTHGENPHVVVQAVAMDLENNISVSIEKRRRITKKKSKDSIDEDDINLAANACSAIAFRDATFKIVPLALVKPVFEAARKVAIGDARTLSDRRARCLDTFSKMGLDKVRVLSKLEKRFVEEIDLLDLELLIGLYNAIKEGEVQIDEAFPPVATPHKGPELDKAPFRNAEKPAKPAAKMPQDAPEGVQIPPKAEKPSVQSPASESMPAGEPVDGGFEAAEPKPASEPTAEPTETTQEPVGEPDPLLSPDKNDTDAVASLKLLAAKSGVTWGQLRGWLLAKKLMKPEQKTLNELAGSKVDALLRTWPAKLPEIRSVKEGV